MVDDLKPFFPLKANWFHILLSLAPGDQHGYGIMQDVTKRNQGEVKLWPATLYGTIRQLLEAGLIEESKSPAPGSDDPRRKYYRLTLLGRRVLTAEHERLRDLVQFLDATRIQTSGAN